jgi:hypothetical protein
VVMLFAFAVSRCSLYAVLHCSAAADEKTRNGVNK